MAFAFLRNNACTELKTFRIHSLETICVISSVFLQAWFCFSSALLAAWGVWFDTQLVSLVFWDCEFFEEGTSVVIEEKQEASDVQCTKKQSLGGS